MSKANEYAAKLGPGARVGKQKGKSSLSPPFPLDSHAFQSSQAETNGAEVAASIASLVSLPDVGRGDVSLTADEGFPPDPFRGGSSARLQGV